MLVIERLRGAAQSGARSMGVFFRDAGHGLLEISHNTLAMVGLAAVAALVFGVGRADLRHQIEVAALDWLQTRHGQRDGVDDRDADAVADLPSSGPSASGDPKALSKQQAAVANWIARRYKVAPEPIGALVHEAWAIGHRAGLDPTLILAIMAVESSFNPYAQSPVGAQGLMQVMTRVHDDKYQAFGGVRAAFDPISNLRVGVQVLKECIARAGSLQEGLRRYVGASLLETDGGYAGRVISEQARLRAVAEGKRVPPNAPFTAPPSPAPVQLRADEPSAPPAEPAPPEAPALERVASLR